MAHIERTVFSNPRAITPAADTAGLEILAGGRQIGEIELIGRRIKRLLLEGEGSKPPSPPAPLPAGEGSKLPSPPAPLPAGEGSKPARLPVGEGSSRPVRPGQIAVVFRRPQPSADLVSEVFQRLEIPFFLDSGRSLGRVPAITMLLRLLELDADDWPMHKLLGVLGNNYFAPDWVDWNYRAAGLAEYTIRNLQIPRGRQRLLDAARSVRGGGRGERGAGSGEQGAGGERGAIAATVQQFLPGLGGPEERVEPNRRQNGGSHTQSDP